jgi:geranylgeranyl reductase family protein
MDRFDAIVAGSGPAGLAAACTLCGAGMKTALIDKCFFPRDKLCGGLLSSRTRQVFESIFGGEWAPGIEMQTCGARVLDRKGLLTSVENAPPLYLTSRKTFDSHLFALTEKKGPSLFMGSPVVSIGNDPGQVVLRNGTVLTADFIIGADGVTSRIREGLFPDSFDKNRHALCLQTDVPLQDLRNPPDQPEVYFGFIRWGYGWVFPKKDRVSIGVGGSLSRNRDMKKTFVDFYRHTTGKEPRSVRGHYMPCGDYLKRPGKKNVLLAGDAAGLVDPITGEGIAFAMESGKYAAEAVLKAARSGEPGRAYDLYLTGYKDMVQFFRPAKVIRRFIFPGFAQKRFIRAMSRPKGSMVLQSYMDVIAGEKSYYRFICSVAGRMLINSLS